MINKSFNQASYTVNKMKEKLSFVYSLRFLLTHPSAAQLPSRGDNVWSGPISVLLAGSLSSTLIEWGPTFTILHTQSPPYNTHKTKKHRR